MTQQHCRRVTFVADFSSPIARHWIAGITAAGIETHVLSTRAWSGPEITDVTSFTNISTTLESTARTSRLAVERALRRTGSTADGTSRLWDWRRRLIPALVPLATRGARKAIATQRPDLVHGLRIPIEGLIATRASDPNQRIVLSIWGNDLSLWADSYRSLGRLTTKALHRASGLITDCQRDQHLAQLWGFNPDKPSTVLPGNGGVDFLTFGPRAPDPDVLLSLGIETNEAVSIVFNPRGARRYVRTAAMFHAIPIVLRQHPSTRFVFADMRGNTLATTLRDSLDIGNQVVLLPKLTPTQMAAIFQRAEVSVSLATHDGTPNTLLEAMACGSFPVVGELDSIREWIDDGTTGLFCDPSSPDHIASVLTRALADDALRKAAREKNLGIVTARASFEHCLPHALEFYNRVVRS